MQSKAEVLDEYISPKAEIIEMTGAIICSASTSDNGQSGDDDGFHIPGINDETGGGTQL